MEYFHSFFDTKISEPTAVTVGKFDGIHKGHTLLCEDIIRKKKEGYKSCLITFSESPNNILSDEDTPSLITTRERAFLLENMGLDYLIECPFDGRLMKTSADDFIRLLAKNFNMKYMVAGADFTFGYKGEGKADSLDEYAKKFGFGLKIYDKIQLKDRDISSTYIREELQKGHISAVNEMLGYDYFVWGEVVHGRHLGTQIGIPTINIIPESNKMIPKFGVYATKIDFDGRIYHGVTNVGIKPSVTDENIVGIETNILDYSGNLYGRFVKITFHKYIREEKKFATIKDLKNQMNMDKVTAKEYFNR